MSDIGGMWVENKANRATASRVTKRLRIACIYVV
jgi:hypothetical protein